eukprot:11181594-Lingulodinium_polyedra.AAC.1
MATRGERVKQVVSGTSSEAESEWAAPARRARKGPKEKDPYVFKFGKCRNEKHQDITEESPDYFFWGLGEQRPG